MSYMVREGGREGGRKRGKGIEGEGKRGRKGLVLERILTERWFRYSNLMILSHLPVYEIIYQ